MMRKAYSRIVWTAALAVISLAAGCGQPVEAPARTEAAPPPADKPLTIGVMPKLIGIEYFNASQRGALEAGKELGVKVDFDGPVQPDVTKQAQMVETWITKKYDAIAIAPNDKDAISPVLQKARKNGIKVLSWDTDAQPASRDFFANQAKNEGIAKTLVDIMVEAIGENGKFIYISGTLTAENQNAWMREMDKYRAEKYPNLVNLSDTPKATEEDQALATQVTIDSLKAYPDLQGIFALTSVALPGAAEGIRKSGAADRITLTGLSTPSVMREYIKDGTLKKFALWSPVDLGYLTVYAAVAAVRGELTPGATTFAAGRLGEVTIEEGGVIILGPPTVFDSANIDQFDF